MSDTRSIYHCLERATCKVTARGKAVFRSSMIGLGAGTLSGAALGGLSVGFHDARLYGDGNSDFRSNHKDEFPERCVQHGNHQDCERPGLDPAANAYGLSYAKEHIAKDWQWIFLGCTIGGAALGLFAGALKGWRKELPPESLDADLEAQNANYQQMSPS